MHAAHHPIFVVLSILTAWFGSWTALDLFRRVRAHGGAWRVAWIAAAGIAMGLSIWSMHFIAMLGFDPGGEVRYEIGLTLLSLGLAIATTAFAFFFASRHRSLHRQVFAGVTMGAGICTMHYVGMAALITGVVLTYEPVYAVLAFIVAVSASTGALMMAAKNTTGAQRALGACALGFAIVGMHYSAMLGVQIDASSLHDIEPAGIDSIVLAIGVAAGTFFILLLTLIAALHDRRVEALALRAALQSEQQLRAVLDNLPIGVLVAASPAGEVRFANAEAERLLGRPIASQAIWDQQIADGVVDQTGNQLLPREYVLYKAMAENRRVGPQLQSYRRPDGAVVQFETTAAPVQAGDQERLTVAAFQDVTAKLVAEHRAAEAIAAKSDAEAALMHAQRLDAIGRLTGGVAHDFNNLLTVVIGALDVILKHPENAARRKRLGEAALAAARRGERLTAQLLAFARRQPLQPQACDLNVLIRECEPLLKRATGESISLVLRLCSDEAVALIDPAQFEASMLNLLVNATDASAAGGEIVVQTQVVELSSAEVSNLPAGRYLQLTVADRGEGMNEAVMSRIFEPFFTTKSPGKGTGLGLSQVYGFVRQSGGEVQVRSAPGAGTTFSVYVPIGASLPVPEAPEPAIESSGDTWNILLTEDDPSVAGIVEVMLADLGHRVVRAENAEEALRVLQSDVRIDVLVSDVVMPGDMNGVALAKRAEQLRPGIKILLSSGYAGETLEESLAHGGDWPFLRKPYLATELAEALARLRSPGSDDHFERRMLPTG
ncbi:MHYT domain-containing protein [Steroidobacter agaridevorans]|uniref:MHYT domain-containing protein n=1 Tax=Steroidobacter agaridevorans TaxID=2695856 RepID=UPI001320C78B|nr:MHYT domain-containing protein [Steroidobacter agaridevorans]GFE87558.1 sensor histidine kinase [Steroidobacter agaridevorans]